MSGRLILILAGLLAASLIMLAGCRGSPAEPVPAQESARPAVSGSDGQEMAGTWSMGIAQSDDQGAVTVQITPLNLDNPGNSLDFEVALDTHSVDLNMDLSTLSTLITDTGHTLKASEWEAPRGGHHVRGVLRFPAVEAGHPVLSGAASIEIQIEGLDAAARTFNWKKSAISQ